MSRFGRPLKTTLYFSSFRGATESPLKNKKKKRQKQKKREHPYKYWVKYFKKIHEADIKHKIQIQAIADFFKNVLSDSFF